MIPHISESPKNLENTLSWQSAQADGPSDTQISLRKLCGCHESVFSRFLGERRFVVANIVFYVILAPCHSRTSPKSASAQRLMASSCAPRALRDAKYLQTAARKVAPSSLYKSPMLPKRSRLSKQTIEKHLIRARRIKTSRFLVMYGLIPGLSGPQVSFTASKKVAPKAVVRNKLRRRGYSAVKALIPRLSPTAAVLISYGSADVKVPISEITIEIQGAFQKAGILKL